MPWLSRHQVWYHGMAAWACLTVCIPDTYSCACGSVRCAGTLSSGARIHSGDLCVVAMWVEGRRASGCCPGTHHARARACAALQGKRLLRLWFLRPVINLEVLDDRQNTVELLLAQPDLVDALRAELKKVGARVRPPRPASYTACGAYDLSPVKVTRRPAQP